ncbi:retrovirus-related pol polyprotein from transposon TNT 1-94 [Tanacetum coccineum]
MKKIVQWMETASQTESDGVSIIKRWRQENQDDVKTKPTEENLEKSLTTTATRYYKDDSCWSADLKSKTTEDIISIGSFMEVLVLIQYVHVRNIVSNNQVKDNKIDLLVQQYEQLVISEDESIDSAFARFNTIITSLKALDESYFSKNYVRKFLRALHPKWRAKVMTIEESKDLTSLSIDELIENLKVHKMIIKKDSKIVKAKGERKSLALKAKKESSDEECLTSRKPPKEKNQRAFIEGSWSDSGEEEYEKVKDETCLVAQASSEICLRVDMEPDEWIKDMDDEPMWAADYVVAPTPCSAITILETRNEFAIKDAWLRMKEMLQNYHGHNLSKGNIIKIFYHGLSEITQDVLNAAVDDTFLYKTPNQAYHLLEDKELISNKHKIKQISAAFLSDESSAMIHNKVPPKLGDPRSFLIPWNLIKTFSCNALADLDASINLMPFSLYANLSLETLKPTKMSVRIADRSFQYPVGIAEIMLVEVGKFTFLVDFVILKMEEDSKFSLILG